MVVCNKNNVISFLKDRVKEKSTRVSYYIPADFVRFVTISASIEHLKFCFFLSYLLREVVWYLEYGHQLKYGQIFLLQPVSSSLSFNIVITG